MEQASSKRNLVKRLKVSKAVAYKAGWVFTIVRRLAKKNVVAMGTNFWLQCNSNVHPKERTAGRKRLR